MPKKANRTHAQQFMDKFNVLAHSRNNGEVWSDFVLLIACSISNAVDSKNYAEREQRYMSVIGKYSADESNIFAELLAITVLALEENPEQDFLGTRYEQDLKLGSFKKGQFFTPYHVGELMAELKMGDLDTENGGLGYTSVNDCCCGAGCLLLAFANVARKHSINYQQQILFVAQDVDQTAALMCYIQLSLLGCAGYVLVGNTLTVEPVEPENTWYTPLYFHKTWGARREEACLKGILEQVFDLTARDNIGIEDVGA